MKAKLSKETERQQRDLNKRIARSRLIYQQMKTLSETENSKTSKETGDALLNMQIERDFQAKEKKDLEREANKKEARQAQMKEITAYNKQMAEEKHLKQSSQEQEEREYFLKCNLDREAAIIAEDETQRKKKITGQKKYCNALRDQIESLNQHNVGVSGMNEVEKSINRRSIEIIDNDSALREKIYEKIRKKG